MVPRISVLMAVYNAQRFLEETIQSVLEQSYPGFEFIIVDDCSTDSTWSIICRFAGADPRIRPFRMEENQKQTRCLVFGIEQCRGEFIARIDGDDVMFKDRLQCQIAFLDQHPEIGLVGGWAQIIDEGGAEICCFEVPTEDPAIRRCMARQNPFLHPSVVFRRGLIQRAGSYDARLSAAQDYELWLRFAEVSGLANLPWKLIKYRLVGSGVSLGSSRRQALEVFRIRWRAVLTRRLPASALFHLWRPLVYVLTPRAVLSRWFEIRKSRDVRKGTFVLR